INYMSYDCCRAQDSLNPCTHADIIVLAHEDECAQAPHMNNPYWYAHIISIFHTTVKYCGMDSTNTCPQCIDFLWVCWYAHDAQHKSGWHAKHLHHISFFNVNNDPDNAFGFLDPCQVIQGVHLIPAFMYGGT
ncbi:hypothetical protein M404DRAFT_120829, partial [Pisolithus tinctorius Marx 270]